MKILLLGEYSGLNKELKAALQVHGHDVTLAAASDFWKKFEADISLGHGSTILSYKFRQFALPFLKLKKLTGFDVVHVINFYVIPRSPLLNLFLVKFLKENLLVRIYLCVILIFMGLIWRVGVMGIMSVRVF